jgi:bifunctional DNA-binding transcriptional regulator/antitoxin component of YhaV-PrlF toxin-antitoxin module
MKRLKVSSGGQVSVPASVRKRWGTHTLVAEDHGSYLVLRPAPDDPVAAAKGAFRDQAVRPSEAIRREARSDERVAERRRSR